MLTETKITAELVKRLRKEHHALILNVHGSTMQASGWPDLYIVHWKFQGFVECKGANTKLHPLQISVGSQIVSRGGKSFVLRFSNELAYTLSNHDESTVIKKFRFHTYSEAAASLLLALEGV